MVTLQPEVVTLPVPVAKTTPPQQKRYSPVVLLNSTTFPVFVSSCKQPLNTLTMNEQLAVLPEPVVAVQVTVVVPTGNIEPLAGLQTTVAPGQLPVVGVGKVTTVPVEDVQLAAATAVMSPGQVMPVQGCIQVSAKI
jgi:hypothetical protein